MSVRLICVLSARPTRALAAIVASMSWTPTLVAQDSLLVRATAAPANAIWLDTLDLSTWQQRRQRPRAKLSLRGRPITMNGVAYPHGVGTLTINEFLIDVKGEAERFIAMVGIDDEMKAGRGSVNFEVWADDKLVASSGVIRAGQPPKLIVADDMLVVGSVGWGPDLHPTRLTQNEQVLHLTLWAMQAAPLLIGADMSQLDAFTVALLTNDEVLDVDQDTLGKAGGRVWKKEKLEVWSRQLSDGTTAVALFNRGMTPSAVTARWSDIGVKGRQPVRNLWLREDVGIFDGSYTVVVPRHGAVMIKVGKGSVTQ